MSNDELQILEQLLDRLESEGLSSADEARVVERALGALRCVGCAYCGLSVPRSRPGAERAAMQAHMLQCSKHPLGQALAEIERLKAELAKGRRAA